MLYCSVVEVERTGTQVFAVRTKKNTTFCREIEAEVIKVYSIFSLGLTIFDNL